MYRELFISRIKLLCRRKVIPLFSLLLPLFFMAAVNITLSALPQSDNDRVIELGVVSKEDVVLPESFLNSSRFHIIYSSREELDELLKEKEIAGYLIVSDKMELHINENGREQTLIESYLDLGMGEGGSQFTKNGTDGLLIPDGRHLAFIYITTLICLLGARWGFKEMNELLPGESYVGKKLRVSPVSENWLLIVHLSAVYVLHTVCIAIYSFIMIKTIGRPLGISTEAYLGTVALGSLSSVLTGALVCTLKRVNFKLKDVLLNIILAVMLSAAFLIPGAYRYIISSRLPYLKAMNPSVLITEMLYSLTGKDGILLFLQDGLLLFAYTLAVGLWMVVRYKRMEK